MKFTITRGIKAQQRLSRHLIASGKTIAVVPTMGFLHDGHLSLIRRGRQVADVVVTTIFVNPTQFSPGEDFDRYPREVKRDIEKIRSAGGQVVFIPATKEIYPDGYETYVTVENLTRSLEGRSRPTHFRGVTTVVAKLFNIIRPDIALFGMKDYQQVMVIRRMVRDLNWPLRIIVCPTIREKDGLAMSSRNSYLSPALRQQAPALYASLKEARRLARNGIVDVTKIEKGIHRVIREGAPEGVIDYIAFTEMESLLPVRRIGKKTVVSLAVRLGPVRLIDNIKIS